MTEKVLSKSRPKTKLTGTSIKDRVTEYARAVVDKKIIAGPHVRDACARHVKDLETGHLRGLKFEVKAAELAIDFYADVLYLNGREFEGQPFVLNDWQCFIAGSIYGWKKANGYRRFQIIYVETGKGSGKSPLAAGVGIKELVGGVHRAEIYSAATKKEQATILFKDAVAMVRHSPALRERLTIAGSPGREYNIAYLSTMSFFKPISSDDGQSGPRPHVGLIDELHEHKDSFTVEMMKAGFKNDPEPILFIITNSGAGMTGVCRDYHDYAIKVAAGTDGNEADSDSFFSYVCALDQDDDPMRDEACWVKSNPSLPLLPGYDYLRQQVAEAKGMPSKESKVRRFNFCQWVAADNPWLSGALWTSAQLDYDLEAMRGRRCYAGLDLSATTDTTALVLNFEPKELGEPWKIFPLVWLPKQGLADKDAKDRVPYLMWEKQGHLLTTPGAAISQRDLGVQIAQIVKKYELDLVKVAYDRHLIETFKSILNEEGIDLPLEPFGQGYVSMAPAVNKFEELLLNGQLKHNGHPILTSHAANTVLSTDAAGNRKPAKDKATGRIDSAVAAIMAVGISSLTYEEDEMPGIIIL
jgi:phage terminase large subunit-like protein